MEIDVSGRSIDGFTRNEIREFAGSCLDALRRIGVLDRDFTDLSIALVSDRQIRDLNDRFRGRDSVTDVLTFPGEPGPGSVPMGDVVISVSTARRQAKREGHSVPMEIRYLLLHGILHALGYDHETDDGEMNALEISVRDRLGLS